MEETKRMILVTSPPACGKTKLSKKLATELKHIVYLDKDSLIPLSKQIFAVANQPYNRSSDFFEKEIRDYEYVVIVDMALEALKYENTVLVNAPFTREIRDMDYINNLKAKLAEVGAKLSVVWIVTDPEVCHQRMIDRASDRDTWKLEHWDEYISSQNFVIPENLRDPDDDESLLLYYNSTDEMADESFAKLIKIFEKE
ncbi:MAG: AAA family ATPase [Clostridia bacterium]|nr:AAA family ATPase [Clostridia bacterium]